MPDTARLDVRERFDKIREQYQSRRRSFNALIIGDYGTGKTKSLATLPKPLLIFQFDPGGAMSLEPEIQRGDEIYVLDFSADDPHTPTQYREFEKTLRDLHKDGTLEAAASIALDSLTTFADILMGTILAANGRAPTSGRANFAHGKGQVVAIPELRDYQVQIATLEDMLGFFTGVAPHFICNAHITLDKDEVTGRMHSYPMVTGRLKQKIPLLFDEVYLAEATSTPNGMKYGFITQPKGIHRARTRLGADGKLAAEEPQDYTAILNKVGFATS